jgi:protein-S-isoprenylcysteine O-methyltransferase Ste14
VRLFDSHIRSVEPTMLGWVVALICYQPFYSVIGQFYLHYDGNVDWSGWLAPTPVLRDLWGMLIVALSIFYGLATAAFGLRFSNLTHRGILTNGPYRLTKHPAYVSKNLSWWLISVPFVVSGDWPTTIRHCALLLLLNTVYFLRARTEEWHLSRDPNYVTYALWMNEHSVLRVFGRLIPALRYRAPSRSPR